MAKYKIVGVPKKAKSSEYFELDLTPEEIEEYAKGGFIIEDISVPTLNHMQDGGESDCPEGYRKDENGDCIKVQDAKEVIIKNQWEKDREKYDPDNISWYESWNPKKWGLNDYSDYSSYNSAFRNARENNEKEFVYKEKRYNTKLIPKKDSDLYWESKDFVNNYYKTQPYYKQDEYNSPSVNTFAIEDDYIKNKFGTTWLDLYNQTQKIEKENPNDPRLYDLNMKLDAIMNEESEISANKSSSFQEYSNKQLKKAESKKSNERIASLNKPSYFSITSQKPSDMAEDGYWDPEKNKTFMRTNTEPGKFNTTYVHELSHKADDILDVMATVPKINMKVLNNENPFSNDISQEEYEYVSSPSEIEARKMSTLFFLKKHNIPWEAGKITDKTISKLYDYYYDKKLPYDIEQLLRLYGGQQEDLKKYLNGDFNYKKGGTIKYQDGGQIYTYSGNPNASYEKVGDQWYISNKGTGNKFVPIQDPDGKRTAELNKNAVLLPGQPAPVEAPRPVQGAPRPVISRHVWEDATGTTYQNAIAEKKYLEGLKMSPKLADQELAKQIELRKANAEKARKARDEYKMLHEQPLDMMDWAWGAAAALPVALPAIGEVAATSIYGSPLTYGNVGSLGFATHSALNADNVVQDWKDVYAGKKDWRDAALNTGITGLGFIGAGSGIKNLASTLSGERVVASAMPGFNTAKAFIEGEKLGDELANFKFNANALNKNAIVGTTPKQLPSSPNALPIPNLSSKISRDVDPGGKSLIKFGDEAHPGGEYYHIDPEDYNIFNEQTGKLELDPNWKQEGLRNANESLNSYLSKLPSYSSEATKGLGSYEFAEFSPGWEALQEAKGMLAGKQKTVGPKDYYTDSEFYKLLEDQMKYDIAYGDAEYAAMLRNEKLDENLFSELFPGLKQPDFRQKFLTTEQEKYVYNQLTQNPSVQSNPIGKQNLQKVLEDNQLRFDAIPGNEAIQDLKAASAEDVITHFGPEYGGVSQKDLARLSPEQMEKAKELIIKNMSEFYKERYLEYLFLSGKQPYKVQNINLNAFGGSVRRSKLNKFIG